MRHQTLAVLAFASIAVPGSPQAANAQPQNRQGQRHAVQLGPRPFFLVDDMKDGPLKSELQQCSAGPFKPTDFSIGHRGAALQFPEHTHEPYEAGAKMALCPFGPQVLRVGLPQ